MKSHFVRMLFFVVLLSFIQTVPVWAHGDRVYPQVADGGPDNLWYRTKFDISNLGPFQSTAIKNVKVMFFRQNGTAWTIDTNLGRASEFLLDLGANQTIRIETTGNSSTTTTNVGYVIIRNYEGTTDYPEDFEVSSTIFYEVFQYNNIVETVSVTSGQPTVKFSFPVESDSSQGIYTGFAIVNLTSVSNTVNLQLYPTTTPLSGAATTGPADRIVLSGNEQQAKFISLDYFKTTSNFKGMLYGESSGPVSILTLLMTPTQTGPQYATMTPTYYDSLRRNSYMYLRQDSPLDVDIPISDYFKAASDTAPWDILYETLTTTTRRLSPRPNVQFSVLGMYASSGPFDDLTLTDLQNLIYSQNNIDLSNISPFMTTPGSSLVFAVKTGLGRYAKIRIADIITRGSDTSKRDLAFEIYVYK